MPPPMDCGSWAKGTVRWKVDSPDYRNVVVEVDEAEAMALGDGWKQGFYHAHATLPEVYEMLCREGHYLGSSR